MRERLQARHLSDAEMLVEVELIFGKMSVVLKRLTVEDIQEAWHPHISFAPELNILSRMRGRRGDCDGVRRAAVLGAENM